MTRPSFLRSRAIAGLAAALIVAAAVSLASVARADVWSAFKGRIFVSDAEFGSGYSTDAAMIAAVKKQSKSVIKSAGARAVPGR